MDHGAGFGGLLRELRETAGMTQEELAAGAGLSAKAISLLERGERRRPYAHTVTALADALALDGVRRAELAEQARRGASAGAAVPSWPVPPTPLVGRERELRELAALVTSPGPRLVTLTGTGGVGKTRLALAVLDQAGSQFPQGAFFVPLAPLARAELVLTAIVRAIGLNAGERDCLDTLRRHLAGRQVLLVIDNLEHLLEAAPDIADLVATTPGPTVLVTSRAPLRVRGETEYPVAPLWTPEGTHLSTDAVAGSPAGRLFLERAAAASPGFSVTDENAADVAAICRRLSGIPLALEIAAARLRLVGPRQLLARLDSALHDEGARDLPERHRTLRRTVEWSNQLLDPAAQALLPRLSVFAGGFSLESAEAVGADLPGDVLSALGNLVEHALVLAEPTEDGTDVRYRLLEPVAQFAAERLAESGEDTAARLAHAEHFMALAEAAYPHTLGSEQVEWFDLLDRERDNLLRAIGWSVSAGHLELAVRCALGLRMHWLMRGGREEGRRLLGPALASAGSLPEDLRARLLHVLAFCHYGFPAPQLELATEAVQLFRALDERHRTEYSLGHVGYAQLGLGELDEATTAFEEALGLAYELGDESHAAHVLDHLAVVRLRQGQLDQAAELATRALDHTTSTGDRMARQTSLQILGQVSWHRGDSHAARQEYRAALEVAGELSDRVNIAYSLLGLAISDGDGGASVWAARLMGAADRLLEDAGEPLFAWAVGQFQEAAARARAHRSNKAWEAAYLQGRAADLTETVETADQT